jgi:hypothetical protein
MFRDEEVRVRRLLAGVFLAVALVSASCAVPSTPGSEACSVTDVDGRVRTVCTSVEGEPDPRTIRDCALNVTREHEVCVTTRPGAAPVTTYDCGITDVFIRHAYGLAPTVHTADAADAYCAHQEEVHIADQERETGGPCPLVCARPAVRGGQS